MQDKRATIKDVAIEAGVSFSLASQVLRDDPNTTKRESTRRKIFDAASKLNYRHDTAARALRTGKSGVIGVMSRTQPIVTTIVETEQIIVDEVMRRGYRAAIIGTSGKGDDHYENTFQEMLSLRVEGVVMNRVVLWHCREQVEMLQRAGIHVVVIGSSVDDNIDGLMEDDRCGFYESTSHLIRLGYRRIMFLSYLPGYYHGFPLRLAGYKDAMAAGGLPVTDDLLFGLDKYGDENSCQIGYSAALEIIERGQVPEAIVCSNDEVALGAMRGIHSKGLRVPEDIALVGFDGIVLSAYGAMPLTTVAQPKEELAVGAVDLLCRRIEAKTSTFTPEYKILKPRLIVRESCGANLRSSVSVL